MKFTISDQWNGSEPPVRHVHKKSANCLLI